MKSSIEHVYSEAKVAVRIRSAKDVLKPAERAIAELVLQEPERVIHMSVSELAKRAEVGESTVIRFCRTLGYSGYQEFKLRLAQDLVEPAEYIHEKITFKDSVSQLAAKIFQANLQVIEETSHAIDPQQVQMAAVKIAQARKVEIYGIGYSFFTALDAKFKLLRIGVIADAFGDGHLQAMSASALSKRDVAIGVSHSGSSRDTVEALAIARQSGATTVAITNFNPAPVTSVADHTLLTAANDTPLGGEVLTSRIAQLCVVDLLSAAVALQLGKKCLTYIQRASEAVRNKHC
jgi:DNA-binding MurR/RpiR family transcriptional regulator